MLINQKVKVKWVAKTKKHYESLNYKYTKLYDEFEIDASHLTKGSLIKVKYICDYCKGKNQVEEHHFWRSYCDYILGRVKYKKDCCNSKECMNNKRSESHARRKIVKDKSLQFNFPEIAKEWNYSKNKKDPSEYSYGSNYAVWWICEKGHEWEMAIKKRTRKENPCKNCPYCTGKKVNNENCLAVVYPEIAQQWHPTKNGNLSPYDVTSRSRKKVFWLCRNCDNDWSTPVVQRSSKGGTNCPVCNESKGEKIIREFLLENNIKFVPQYEFDDLIGLGGGKLKFDFAIFLNDKDMPIMIEYDGEFHFKKIYDEDGHDILCKHDIMKNKYCSQNNINLIRIPYFEFNNIEIILRDKLFNSIAF